MPQVEQVRHRSKKPMIFAGIGALAVVVVVIAVVLVVKLTAPQPDVKTVLNNVRDLTIDNKDDEAIALLKDRISKSKSKDDKLSMDMQLGSILESKGDYKGAVETYKAADSITSGFGTRYAIARASAAGGDKAVALEYYKKCQTMLKNGESAQNSDYLPIIENAISKLEAKS